MLAAKSLLFFSALCLLALVSASPALALPDFTSIVEKHASAVVNISLRPSIDDAPNIGSDADDSQKQIEDLMRHFFSEEGGKSEEDGEEGSKSNSLGSGFIISQDGYVVTNAHVIEGEGDIIVTLTDRREFVAKMIGSDKRSDLALLKIPGEKLPALKLGSSSNTKIGEWVVAIGSPFGFDYSVTAGIVSAKGRNLPSDSYVPFLQTDVAINPGNSGGPLFNLKGEVIGINSLIYSRTGGFMGVSFAIPSDMALSIINQLREKGRVSRGWIGIYIQEVTTGLALSFGLNRAYGALIAEVSPSGPAHGVLRQGDIILEFNGKSVDNSSMLPIIVGNTPVDKEASVKLSRGGKVQVLKVKVAELPTETLSKDEELDEVEEPLKPVKTLLGMELENLDDEAKEALGVSKGGVLINRVIGQPAFNSGIERGDIIIQFNNQPVQNYQQLLNHLSKIKEPRSVALLALRDGSAKYFAFQISAKQLKKRSMSERVSGLFSE